MKRWPEIFRTGVIKRYDKKTIIVDTLKALELSEQTKCPKQFSKGLYEVSKFLGCAPTEKNLMRLQQEN